MHLKINEKYTLIVKGWKCAFWTNGIGKQVSVVVWIADKIYPYQD